MRYLGEWTWERILPDIPYWFLERLPTVGGTMKASPASEGGLDFA